MKTKKQHFFAVWTTLFLSYSANGFECKFKDYDLSPLNRTWEARSDGGDIDVSYKISICAPLTSGSSDSGGCHSDTAVCMTFANGTSYSTGNFSSENMTADNNEETGEMWMFFSGDRCPEFPRSNLTVSINFKCGPTMGSPKFLNYIFCVSYFEWESHVYCKGEKPEQEVPCYLYDEQGSRYDLSPLTKKDGGYLVSSEMNTDVYINVCRDVSMGSTGQNCPSGNGGYRKTGSDCVGLGKPRDGLQRSARGLMLKYVSDGANMPSGCTTAPSTTITFICPKRGGSKDPLVIQDFDCQYDIEWETEYACPEAKLSSSTCKLTMEDADIDIDLTPLKLPPGSDHPYSVKFNDSSSVQYEFFLNVCGELGIPCPTETKYPSCQTKVDSEFAVNLGTLDHMKLRYADGDLVLIYKGGDLCHHNNAKRETVIEFICDLNADNEGRGHPTFEPEDDCVYKFSWKTKYACLDHPVDEECRVNDNGKRYDLSALVRRQGTNWEALGKFGARKGQYYINVCHNVLQTEEAARCDPGAAVCYRDAIGSVNLGRYELAPKFDNKTKTIKIQYTNGDTCTGGKRKSSTITFICRPGDSDSAPTLTHVSFDECIYEFEWRTSAACVLGHYLGTHCKVYDEDAGFNFDLSPLTKSGPPYYTVDPGSSDIHEYLLNVCGPVTGTSCNTLTGQAIEVGNTGICQQPKQGQTGDSYVAGQFSSELHYYDGMINLTYAGGSPYHDDAQTPRRSEITFLCDPDAGIGSPIFLSEIASEHYYGFEWRTAYACPSPPMECSVIDTATDTQYDLSSLSMDGGRGNWAVESTDGATKYYINVCKALNKVNVGSGCGALASVCRTKISAGQPETVDIPNLGQVKSGLTVVEKGHLQLVYEGPTTCNNGSATLPYKTTLDFVCVEGQVLSSPSSPVETAPCEYTILWTTASACPLTSDELTSEPCTVKDPNSDYVFNLQPLIKKGEDAYSVTVGSTEYKLNICGNLSASVCGSVEGGVASVCSIAGSTKTAVATGLHYQLDFNEAGRMALVYHGHRKANGIPVEVKVNFECAPDVDLGQPEFVGQDEDTYMFTFKTSLACAPMATDCFVQDKYGNEYDLGPLAREDGWPVMQTTDDKTKYFINVCRPVNNIQQSNCPDGPIGGCQVSANGVSYNIGYIQAQPIASGNDSLTIRYRNGDVCHKGTPNEAHRSTRINFFCSQVEHGPEFESETQTCEYIFNWQTPAACRLQSNTGQNCQVTEPRYGYQFDLNLLRKNNQDYHVVFGEYDYLINACGPLVESGNCDQGAGACQTKPNSTFTPVHAGKANSDLRYAAGELTLTYSDGKDKCHGKYTRKTIIKFVCNQLKNGQEGPVFIKETFNCQYLFVWTTQYACTPHMTIPCTYSDPQGNAYDLTGLTLYDDNYDYTDTANMKRYLINVCMSVIHKANATCPYYAAACMVDLSKPDTDKDKYISLGSRQQQLTMEDGKLTLVYTGGHSCEDGKDHTTKVTFICDPSAKDSSPTGHFMSDDCTHHFLWSSAAACPIQKTGPGTSNSTTGITCKVTEPITGTQLDLSVLRTFDDPWNVQDSDGHLFEFNVCAPLKKSKCSNTSASIGVCQSETGGSQRTFNAGNAINDLWYDDGVVVYNLTGGDRCHGERFERNTIINFVCNGNKGLGRPVFLDETDDCTYYISWHTNIVCVNEVKCSVDTPDFHTLDLSPLSRLPDNIVQSSLSDAVYYLSVCQPLQPIPGTVCPSGASACEVKANQSAVSLGKPKSPPTFDSSTGEVTLSYMNGSTCDVDPSKNFTSRVTFSCQPGPVRSNPVLLDKVGCEYLFRWPTAVVCYDKQPQNASEECAFSDPWTNTKYNFSLLARSTPFEVSYLDTKYLISMCGSVKTKPSCKTAMVCRDNDSLSFGEPKDFRTEQSSNMITLTYKSGGKCADGSVAASQILFQCDRSADIGRPMYLTGSGCQVAFLWKTSIICPPLATQCSLADGPHLYDMSPLTRDNGAWNFTDGDGNTYWINICGALDRSVGGGQCGQNSGACRQTKGGYDNLGEVTSQLGPYKDATTGAIIIEYREGGPACSDEKRRSDNSPAKTRIRFLCGKTYGGPKFVQRTGDCWFEFEWKTRLACAVKREEVPMQNGKLIDPRSGGTINLNSVLKTNYTVEPKDGTAVYQIRLNGNSTYCIDGVVCDVKDKTHPRLLGTHKSAKYFIDDELLEAVYTTTERCADGASGLPNQNVTSIIHFHCSKKQNQTIELLYKSKDCMFVFDWETPVACLEPQVLIPANGGSTAGPGSGPLPGSGSSSASAKEGVSGQTVGAIVGVFSTAILVCILLVVFHKQERRAACLNGVRRVLRLKSSEYTQMRYHRLPTDAADDLQGEEDILTFSDPANTETNRDESPLVTVATTPPSYHDDSDEDLLA